MLTTNQIRKVIVVLLLRALKNMILAVAHPLASPLCCIIYLFSLHFFLSQDLSSPNQYDTGVALTGLSCFVTPDLARDLANDIMTLVSHGEYVKRLTNKDLRSLVLFFRRGLMPFIQLEHNCLYFFPPP